ncbi:MAG: hypothetical protein ABIN96_05585, partial [Rubrivivax sp.]
MGSSDAGTESGRALDISEACPERAAGAWSSILSGMVAAAWRSQHPGKPGDRCAGLPLFIDGPDPGPHPMAEIVVIAAHPQLEHSRVTHALMRAA